MYLYTYIIYKSVTYIICMYLTKEYIKVRTIIVDDITTLRNDCQMVTTTVIRIIHTASTTDSPRARADGLQTP